MTGFLKGNISVPVLVQRLKEDYPIPPQPTPIEPPPPGFTRPIIKPTPQGTLIPPQPTPPPGFTSPIGKSTSQETQSWTVEDEIKLRVEMVSILGGVAGESQGSFLEYLALNDPKTAVKDAASEAFKSLNIRVAQSTENYNKGLKLRESGNINEAISLFQTALKENPDAPYAEEIKKLQAQLNYNQALVLLKENKKEEAVALLRSALNLDPAASFKKEAENKLAELQTPAEKLTEFSPPGFQLPRPAPRPGRK